MSSKPSASPPPNFAALFPYVIDACDAGDALAIDVLRRGGSQLGAITLLVVRQLWPEESPVTIATAGGAISHSERLRQMVENRIHSEWPQAKFVRGQIDAAQGALYIARNAKT